MVQVRPFFLAVTVKALPAGFESPTSTLLNRSFRYRIPSQPAYIPAATSSGAACGVLLATRRLPAKLLTSMPARSRSRLPLAGLV